MREFERKIINELLSKTEFKHVNLSDSGDNEDIEFTGAGYYLTVRNSIFPVQRLVLSKPGIRGSLGGIDVGFVAFIENCELVLECYSYDREVLPEHRYREFQRYAP